MVAVAADASSSAGAGSASSESDLSALERVVSDIPENTSLVSFKRLEEGQVEIALKLPSVYGGDLIYTGPMEGVDRFYGHVRSSVKKDPPSPSEWLSSLFKRFWTSKSSSR